jgi:hypothetical protein
MNIITTSNYVRFYLRFIGCLIAKETISSKKQRYTTSGNKTNPKLKSTRNTNQDHELNLKKCTNKILLF